MAGHRGQVDEIGRVGLQGKCRVVEGQPAILEGRQQLMVESVGGHHGEIGAIFARQAGQCPAFGGPAAEQQIQRVQRTGGVHHVGVGHSGQRGERGTPGIERGHRGLRRHISTDLGLVAGVLRGGVDGRITLARTGRTVEV